MLLWRIYYGDGTTFGSDQGEPGDAPGGDVQGIVQCHKETGRQVLIGGCPFRHDYFWWDHEERAWYVGDFQGFLFAMARPGWQKPLFGQSIPTKRFRAIYDRMMTDPDFPPKSGWIRGERPAWLTWDDRDE